MIECRIMGSPDLTDGSSGANFVRADLHVHTHLDSEVSPAPDIDRYIDAAIENEIGVLLSQITTR